MLTILTVAYPPAAVGPDAGGGAEQVAAQLDAAITAAGHRSIVLACEGSCVTGELVPVPRLEGVRDEAAISAARARHREAIVDVLGRRHVDIVHMHGHDYDTYMPPPGVTVLATLHCPRAWCSRVALAPRRPETYVVPVSAHQHAGLPRSTRLLAAIENGVDLDAFSGVFIRRPFALMLGRIAPEKGVHVGLDAARLAGLPVAIAGVVDPYPDHARYYEAEVVPRLDEDRRCIGPIRAADKPQLVGEARCLLVCSEVEETSSLVTREALAAGTPVVAFARGALVDAIEHGRTGFLVSSVEEMAAAMLRCEEIDPRACREAARARFDQRQTTAAYLDLYERLARRRAGVDRGSPEAA